MTDLDGLEVAAHIFELDHDDENIDEMVEGKLYEEWGIDLDVFTSIVSWLLPLTPVLESPLSKERYHVLGFHDDKAFIALAKAKEGKA